MDTSTKLVINLDTLHQNITNILSYKKGSFLFVVKGNAYTHGYRVIVEQLNQYDKIQFIGVGQPNEALLIRQHTTKDIVVLGHTPDSLLQELVEQNIIPTIYSHKQATLLPKQARVFVNVDTGFHRIGGRPEEGFQEELEQILSDVQVLGIYTHLTLQNKDNDLKQIEQFKTFIEPYDIPFISISDSIAYTRYNTYENLYRIGALLYGYTSEKEDNYCNVKPVAHLESTVIRTMKVEEDTSAYYRSNLSKGMEIATIPIGYGDGLFRTMPKDAYVVINGKTCHYIETGMEYSIIDITGKNIQLGDKVYIFGQDGLSLGELSRLCHTNKNNLLTMISSRVVREYIKENKILEYTWLGES